MGWRNLNKDDSMGSFILTEIRDLRKGMEGRDGELRGEIAAVRDAVSTLAESLTRSQSNVEAIQSDVETLRTDVKKLRTDVDQVQQSEQISSVRKTSEWNGPKRILGILTAIAGGFAAVVTIIKGWPIIVAFLAM